MTQDEYGDLIGSANPYVPLYGRLYAGSGVYLLCDDNECRYVGESENCARRIRQHNCRNDYIGFTRVAVIPVDDESDREALELEIRRKFKPRLNRN